MSTSRKEFLDYLDYIQDLSSINLNESSEEIDYNKLLYRAARHNDTRTIEKLVETGVNIENRFGSRKLEATHIAAQKGSFEALQTLFSCGAKSHSPDIFNKTPYDFAVEY